MIYFSDIKIYNRVKFLVLIILISTFPLMSYAHANKWQLTTKKDLQEIYHIILTQTPGAVDQQNPQYQHWMQQGFKKAIAMSKKVTSARGYVAVLHYYVNGFHDEHIVVYFQNMKFQHPDLWPGFFVNFNHGKFVVSNYGRQTAKSIPPVNAKLISCDNVPVNKLMLRDIFPYYGNEDLYADWRTYGVNLLIYEYNPWIKRYSLCTYLHNGNKETFPLYWQPYPKTLNRFNVNYSHTGSYSVQNFTDNGLWISIPGFVAKTAKITLALRRLINGAPSWRNKNIIVMDVRNNGGGNSRWGSEILRNLYGQQYFTWSQYRTMKEQYTQWRVTKGNLDYVYKMIQDVAISNGKDSDAYRNTVRLYKKMQQAKLLNQSLLTMKQQNPKPFNAKPKSLYNGKLIIVSNGQCASSCLTFLEQALNIPGTKLVGEPTHADTNYTDRVSRHASAKDKMLKPEESNH